MLGTLPSTFLVLTLIILITLTYKIQRIKGVCPGYKASEGQSRDLSQGCRVPEPEFVITTPFCFYSRQAAYATSVLENI